jgi:rifampin ADP-ribosylating transferase
MRGGGTTVEWVDASNYEVGRTMNYVYFTATLDAAVWGAELASGESRGRI